MHLKTKFYKKTHILLTFLKILKKYLLIFNLMFLTLSCSTIYFDGIPELKKDSKYIKLIQENNKISLRHYFTISNTWNLRYKEPLFLKVENDIIALFLFNRHKLIDHKYLQTFFSVGKDISLKAYLKLIKARKFVITNSSEKIIKTIVFSNLPDSENILLQNNMLNKIQ
ncbi:hypothetical protein Bmayo_06285 (plasmid) [Borreliella mayonii]|uniref:Uncharacterized protein n=1 Tax=Borreliella mayonii TaxID=1674146 RepID=A0AAC9PJJ6_9SPIR|nr:hypothetical protein [Borreliella mayonii]APS99061.1 hypothetical protein A7X70_04355 [Borreliella mayonii]APT00181.1 hypothetical protein Bmayo_06285 [Borreliella mayonii]